VPRRHAGTARPAGAAVAVCSPARAGMTYRPRAGLAGCAGRACWRGAAGAAPGCPPLALCRAACAAAARESVSPCVCGRGRCGTLLAVLAGLDAAVGQGDGSLNGRLLTKEKPGQLGDVSPNPRKFRRRPNDRPQERRRSTFPKTMLGEPPRAAPKPCFGVGCDR